MAESTGYQSKDFRRKLKRYSIDHIVELKVIVAVLLDNGIYEIIKIFDFIIYFNQKWNLQTLLKRIHDQKGKRVSKYILWKFNATTRKPVKDVFDEMSTIFLVYKEKRDEIRTYLNSLDNHTDYLKIEESLFNFLNNTNSQHAEMDINAFNDQSKNLQSTISKSKHLDHILELQILAYILKINKINDFKLELKFVEYFHQDWNFDIINSDRNISKGAEVKEWIKVVGENSGICSDEIRETMKKISDHYSNNINFVRKCITAEKTIDKKKKKQLREVANNLNALFKNNIRP